MSIQTDNDGKTFLSVFPTLSYFALLRAHKTNPFAQHALKLLLQHEKFGASAQRELST